MDNMTLHLPAQLRNIALRAALEVLPRPTLGSKCLLLRSTAPQIGVARGGGELSNLAGPVPQRPLANAAPNPAHMRPSYGGLSAMHNDVGRSTLLWMERRVDDGIAGPC